MVILEEPATDPENRHCYFPAFTVTSKTWMQLTEGTLCRFTGESALVVNKENNNPSLRQPP